MEKCTAAQNGWNGVEYNCDESLMRSAVLMFDGAGPRGT